MITTLGKYSFQVATALSLGLILNTGANGADSPQAGDNSAAGSELTEVVVTARRVAERLQDVPMSITVLSQRDLTDYNISSAGDLAAYVPALSVSSQFGSDASSFVIRGFSQDIGTSPTVGTYFADVVAPRGGFGGTTIHAGEGSGPGSLFDLENVEILKGPQGTLFGRNTTGGAILLVPKKPTSQFEGYAEASGGDYGLERVQAAINVPINDQLRIRAGFDQQKRDGYVKNISDIGPSTFNNIDYGTFRLSVVFNITPNLENYTIGSYTKSDNHSTDTQIVACKDTTAQTAFLGGLACAQLASEGSARGPYTVNNSVLNARSYIRQWQLINTTTWTASDDLTFKNIASYSQVKVINDSGLFGDNFKLAGFPLEFTAEDTPPNTPLSSEATVTDEPRVEGHALGGKLEWQAGLYFELSYPIGISGSSGPNLVSCTNFQALDCFDLLGRPRAPVGTVGRRTGTVTWRDYGAYAQDTYAFTDQLKLTTGFRYSDDIMSATTTRYSYQFPPAVAAITQVCEAPLTGNCMIHDHVTSNAPTGLVNLQYSLNPNLLSYVQYARGYRQGGILSTGPIDNTTYKPEHLNAYEAGIKSTFQGQVSGILNAAFFYNDFSDQQIQGTFVSTNPAVPVNAGILNAGKSRIWGFDLDSAIAPVDWFKLSVGYTYLDSKLVKINPLTPNGVYNIFGPNEPQGSELTFSPHNKVALTGTYYLPVDRKIGKMSVGATYLYTSSQLVFGTGPYASLPATHLMNLNANWESVFSLPVDLEFFMTNVTNLHYPTYVDNFVDLFGLTAESFGPPRMFGGRFRVHF